MNPYIPAEEEEFKQHRERSLKTWLCIIKEQINKEFIMKWNESFNIAKDKNVWKTLHKDHFV